MEKWFLKLYIKAFCSILMASSSNYVRVLGCIIRHTNYANELDLTPKEIGNLVNCSPDTVNRIIKDLVSCDFMRKASERRYMLNPACLMRGSYCRFAFLCKKYDDLI